MKSLKGSSLPPQQVCIRDKPNSNLDFHRFSTQSPQ